MVDRKLRLCETVSRRTPSHLSRGSNDRAVSSRQSEFHQKLRPLLKSITYAHETQIMMSMRCAVMP